MNAWRDFLHLNILKAFLEHIQCPKVLNFKAMFQDSQLLHVAKTNVAVYRKKERKKGNCEVELWQKIRCEKQRVCCRRVETKPLKVV